LTTLRALGFIDAEGRPTEAYRNLRLSLPRRRAALRDSLIAAYPGLPGPDEPPPSDDDLHDYFVDQRGLAGQMVQKAMRFYRQLSALARGAAGEQPIRSRPAASRRAMAGPGGIPRRRAQAPELVVPSAQSRPSGASPRETHPITASLTVQLQVPFDVGEAELETLFRRIRRAWEKAGSD
jgi:hypothetical protein